MTPANLPTRPVEARTTNDRAHRDDWGTWTLAATVGVGLFFKALLDAGFAVTITRVEPAAIVGNGSAVIRYDQMFTQIVVPATINGVAARLVIDTGAATTLLTASMAKRANITVTGKTGEGSGIGNRVKFEHSLANSIVIGNASVKDTHVHVLSDPETTGFEGVDGLLGLSFLRNFQMRLGDGVLELTPLAAKRD